MTAEQRQTLVRAGFLVLFGLFLSGFALLAPHQGALDGRSFFAVAKGSSWRAIGDWPAVWCSFKIVLLNVGMFAIIAAVMMLRLITERDRFLGLLLFSTMVPFVGLLIGLFLLIRAAL